MINYKSFLISFTFSVQNTYFAQVKIRISVKSIKLEKRSSDRHFYFFNYVVTIVLENFVDIVSLHFA